MIPSGKGFWQITVSAANLNYPVQWKSDLWLAVPFSAYAKGSLLLGRSRSSARWPCCAAPHPRQRPCR